MRLHILCQSKAMDFPDFLNIACKARKIMHLDYFLKSTHYTTHRIVQLTPVQNSSGYEPQESCCLTLCRTTWLSWSGKLSCTMPTTQLQYTLKTCYLLKISVDVTETNAEIFTVRKQKTIDYIHWSELTSDDPSEVHSPTQYTEKRTEQFEVAEGNDRMETLGNNT